MRKRFSHLLIAIHGRDGPTLAPREVLPKLAIGILTLVLITACSPESSQDSAVQACAAKLFPGYDGTRLDECMKVCKVCGNGNTVTCSTSCKLKGAN